jgi:hypothetical protein
MGRMNVRYLLAISAFGKSMPNKAAVSLLSLLARCLLPNWVKGQLVRITNLQHWGVSQLKQKSSFRNNGNVETRAKQK